MSDHDDHDEAAPAARGRPTWEQVRDGLAGLEAAEGQMYLEVARLAGLSLEEAMAAATAVSALAAVPHTAAAAAVLAVAPAGTEPLDHPLYEVVRVAVLRWLADAPAADDDAGEAPDHGD